jgi:hypothetical protein
MQGEIRAMQVAQAIGFCAGALATPILFGGAMAASGALGKPEARRLEGALLSDAAIDERIDLALAAIAAPAKPPAAQGRRTARRKP